eukprot:11201502-Lingulodinium_polyedra.AAC.1
MTTPPADSNGVSLRVAWRSGACPPHGAASPAPPSARPLSVQAPLSPPFGLLKRGALASRPRGEKRGAATA